MSSDSHTILQGFSYELSGLHSRYKLSFSMAFYLPCKFCTLTLSQHRDPLQQSTISDTVHAYYFKYTHNDNRTKCANKIIENHDCNKNIDWLPLVSLSSWQSHSRSQNIQLQMQIDTSHLCILGSFHATSISCCQLPIPTTYYHYPAPMYRLFFT